jgi:hypothetical protein
MSSIDPIVEYEWVSPVTGKPVDEEWHIFLTALKENYPTAYVTAEDIADRPYLLQDEIAWGYSDPFFDAGQAGGIVGVNVNNSPNFRPWLGGRVRTRQVYVQVEFSYRSTSEGSNTDLFYNPQTIFNRTKRKLESILTTRPKLLVNRGISWISGTPSVLQDGRAFTNFGMVGTLQPAFLETLQDNYKWRYILLFTADIIEKLI